MQVPVAWRSCTFNLRWRNRTKCVTAYATFSADKNLPRPQVKIQRRFDSGSDHDYIPLMALLNGFVGLATALLVYCGLAKSLATTPSISLQLSNQNGNTSSNSLKAVQLNERCTDAPEWMGEGYDAENCASALRLLFFTEVRQHSIFTYEFLSQGVPATTHAVVRTPRRYVRGNCTVAIVMLDFFTGAGMRLPDQPQEFQVPQSDLSTWQGLWVLMTIIQERVGEYCAMGWSRAGIYGGIGLFMWGTGSGMDRSVP